MGYGNNPVEDARRSRSSSNRSSSPAYSRHCGIPQISVISSTDISAPSTSGPTPRPSSSPIGLQSTPKFLKGETGVLQCRSCVLVLPPAARELRTRDTAPRQACFRSKQEQRDANENVNLVKTSTEIAASLRGVKPYNNYTGFAICLNYVVGTGCFGLPYAFSKAGFGLNAFLLLFGGALATISANYTCEFLARSEGVTSFRPDQGNGKPHHRITFRRFDFAMVAEIFTGIYGRMFVQCAIVVNCLGTLWSFSSIFASSTASMFCSYILAAECDIYISDPSQTCLMAYFASMGFFAILVVSLVLMDISEQAAVQRYMTIYRIVAMSIMLSTLAAKIYIDGYDQVSARASNIGSWNFSEFSKGFGPSMLALNCHYNIPNVLQPLESKRNARTVTMSALSLSLVLYILLGILGALAFEEVSPMVSLNWSTFTACGNGWTDCSKTSDGDVYFFRASGALIHLLILLFPVLNIVSAYPMIGVTLGDNYKMSVPEDFVRRFGSRNVTAAMRMLAVLPPMILAATFKKLGTIFAVAGIFGFFLQLTIPCYLQISSQDYCNKLFGQGSWKTQYSVPLISNPVFVQILFVFSFIIVAVAFIDVAPRLI